MLRLSRRAALLLAAVAALALALGQADAKAATPPAGSIGPDTPSTSWEGQFYAFASTPDPTACPPGAVDPTNTLCDHFELTVQSAGSVTVTIEWPDNSNDFDLYVYDQSNMLVASSTNVQPDAPPTESVTFDATAQTYEVRVVPFFVVASGYSGTATFNAPAGGGAGGGTGGGIDPPLSLSNASVAEGDSGTTAMTFDVTMGWATSVPVTVNYVTADAWADGTATAGVDYVPTTGSVVIPPGETHASFSVPVLGDTAVEPDETFLVNLYLPDPMLLVARIDSGQAVGTIRNDDSPHWVRGSGTLTTPLTGAQGHFALNVNESWRRRISYRDASVRFAASQTSILTFDDATHSAHIEGTGTDNGNPVTFVLDVADNGAGALDSYVLTLSDGARGTGTLTSGDIRYHSG